MFEQVRFDLYMGRRDAYDWLHSPAYEKWMVLVGNAMMNSRIDLDIDDTRQQLIRDCWRGRQKELLG